MLGPRCHRLRLILVVLCAMVAQRARAQIVDAGATSPTTLDSSDFTLAVVRSDATGTQNALDTNALQTFFSKARCSCPVNVEVDLSLADTALPKLGTDTLEVTVAVGADCNDLAATFCNTVGATLSLSAQQTSATQTFSSGDLFAAAGAGACSALTSTSTRLWAIVRDNGERLDVAPSLAIGLGAAPPAPPTATTATTADGALLVGWTPGDTTSLSGFQVLCSPGVASPSAAAYDSCEAAAAASSASAPGAPAVNGAADGGVDGGPAVSPFATVDAAAFCSGLISTSASSLRVSGLQNGQAYQIAVIAIGDDGTPSIPSIVATGVPGPTYGISDLYRQAGGQAQGCAVAGGARDGRGTARELAFSIFGAALAFCRRRRRRPARGRSLLVALVPFAFTAVMSRAARAQDQQQPPSEPPSDPTAELFGIEAQPAAPSPQHWNFELRFGPYRPDVDSEFAAQGDGARPYQELFGSGQHLMAGIALDRQVLGTRYGTLSAGLGLSSFRVSAASLEADLQTRSGDQTALRLIPFSATATFRVSSLADRTRVPLIPYAKVGLDCTLWSMSETSKTSSTNGRSFGWHAGIGVALRLDFLDPDSTKSLDQETGINHTSIFVEGTHIGTGLGFGGPQLQTGDTTWLAGLMLEI